MTTQASKLKAIASLTFPKNCKQLETYLGMTDDFRHYTVMTWRPFSLRRLALRTAGPELMALVNTMFGTSFAGKANPPRRVLGFERMPRTVSKSWSKNSTTFSEPPTATATLPNSN
jgi:hypothetical protein